MSHDACLSRYRRERHVLASRGAGRAQADCRPPRALPLALGLVSVIYGQCSTSSLLPSAWCPSYRAEIILMRLVISDSLAAQTVGKESLSWSMEQILPTLTLCDCCLVFLAAFKNRAYFSIKDKHEPDSILGNIVFCPLGWIIIIML